MVVSVRSFVRAFDLAKDEFRLSGSLNVSVIVAGSLICFAMGTVHAYSVFLEPIEQAFGVGRASASFAYSGALISITISVLFVHHLLASVRPTVIATLSCLFGAAGCLIAGFATSIWGIWLGFGLVFGLANGIGYGFSLQIAARSSPAKEGLAMGIITASYAMGAAVAPVVLSTLQSNYGFAGSMGSLAMLLLVVLPIASTLIWQSGISFDAPDKSHVDQVAGSRRELILWLAYGGGVIAGLMVIGHAAGVAQANGANIPVWLAPVIIAVFNLAGSLTGGTVLDYARPGRALPCLPGLSAVGLVSLLILPSDIGIVIGLAVVGFAYGALIAGFPATLTKTFGSVIGSQIYGRVFTAWGCAGLFGPWLAGLLYDTQTSYSAAFIIAIGFNIVSFVAMRHSFSVR